MKHFGLIGRRLGHSWSARLFNEKFRRENIDADYSLFELDDISGLPALIAGSPGLVGLNVTVPFKQDVIPLLGSLDPAAERIGAVNVIDIRTMRGYNTDSPGFASALSEFCNGEDIGEEALICGNGGASKAVADALTCMGIKANILSRAAVPPAIPYESAAEIMSRCRLIVNTTPLGMFPDIYSYPPLPYNLITPHHLCFDLVYNPEQTAFMKICIKQGARVTNGLKMLYNQAMLAWEIWK